MNEVAKHLMQAANYLDLASYAAEQANDTLLAEALDEIVQQLDEMRSHLR